MKTKKLLGLLLTFAMVASMMATLGITASAAPRTDTTPVYVGETYDCVNFVSSVTTFSDEEQDGNLWYFYTTDETKLKVVNCYIEEDAVEGDKLHVFLKGIAVGNGLEILCKQYDAESTSWVDGVSAINGIYNVIPAPVYLDLDENTTEILDNKKLDQTYTLTVTDGTYTDTTKVKLEWTIGNLAVARKDAKIWNPDTLTWDDDNDSDEFTLGSDTTSSTFKLTNLSSVPVKANAVFRVKDALRETFHNVVFTNNNCTVASVVDAATKEVNTETVHEQTITAVLTVNKDKFTGAAAADAAYGTYTVSISAVKDAKNKANATVNQNEAVSLTAANTLSPDSGATTTVEIPANTASFDAGSVAELNVETTAVAEAMANATFNISENESAVSAIDLTVKVNGSEIHDFKDANGNPVTVTVTTYIAKGFTNLTMKYVGTGKDDPYVVSYDSATGKLVFTTTHFSTFAIGANENAYIEENNTAYMFADALSELDAGETLTVLKNIDNLSALSVEKPAGTYTINLGGHEITFAETTVTDEVAFLIEGNGEYVLKNGTFTCTDYHYGDILDIWSVTTIDGLTVNFTDENVSGFARWGAIYNGASEMTIKNSTVNAVKGPGIQNGEKNAVLNITNSTITSGDHSALYCGGGSTTVVTNCIVSGKNAIHACTSGAAFIINSGSFTGSENAIQLDNTTVAKDYLGVPNYVGGSYASVLDGTFTGAIKLKVGGTGSATLEVSGGSFATNPADYLKTGYRATNTAGIYTVTAD